MMKFPFTDYAIRSLIPSPVNQLTQSFADDFRPGTDINLGVGYVNASTIPSKALADAFRHVLAHPDKHRNALNYGSAEGSANLRHEIQSYYTRNAVGGFTEADFSDKAIIIGANGATSILESLAHIFKPGIIITAEPCYYIYAEYLQRCGFTLVGVPEEADGADIGKMAEIIRGLPQGELRFIYMITVNNPTGTILSNAKRAEILRLAAKAGQQSGQTIPVIFDRAYEDIIFSPSVETPQSALLMPHGELAAEVGTLSKIIAPALRIGYLISRKSAFTQALTQRMSDIGFSAPLINQEIASIMLSDHLDEQLASVRSGYRIKALFLSQLFTAHLTPYIETVRGGQAGFYFYIQFRDVETGKDTAFFRFLSRTTGNPHIDGQPTLLPRLIYIPGDICTLPGSSITHQAARAIRISFGYEDTQVLEKAILLIKEAAEYSTAHKK